MFFLENRIKAIKFTHIFSQLCPFVPGLSLTLLLVDELSTKIFHTIFQYHKQCFDGLERHYKTSYISFFVPSTHGP